MAFDVSALAAYIENEDFPLIAKVQVSSNTAALAFKQVGIKKTSNLHYLDTDVIFQDGANCTRSASGTTTFTDRAITVGDIAIYENLCMKDLVGKWAQIELNAGCSEVEMPNSIESVYMEQKMSKLAQQLDVSDWQGDTGSGTNNLSYYDGWVKQIDAGLPVNGNPTGITAATGVDETNIIAVLQGMFKSIPVNIRGRQDLSLFVPRAWFDCYVIALVNANLYHYAGGDADTAKLFGTNVEVRPTDGLLGLDRAFLTYNENLVIGMDGDAEEDNMSVRMDPVTEKNVFFDACFKRGTQIFYPEYVVEFTLVP